MKITILDRNTLTVGDIDFSEIEALGQVEYFDLLPAEQIIEAAKDSEIILCNKAKMTREIISALPKLRYIGLFATGYNNIDLDAADEFGVYVANAPGYSTDSVAQLIFAFILQLAGNVDKYNASVHRGEWIISPTFAYFPYQITELAGKTLGIFGYGSIGKTVARIGNAFGMKVIISTRTLPKDCQYELVTKEELFSRSDFLSLNCPLTPETANLVRAATLSLMKPTAFLINTSRGPVVNESDLADALNSGKLAGAGIDVLSSEPMSADNPLYKAKNCIITPHIAWASHDARVRLITLVASNIAAFQSGSAVNIVNFKKH